jgi:holliday junction DNA helicase RuvA
MIAHLTGSISEKSHQLIILEVQGVGYAVSVCDDRLYKKDQEISLHIYMHWNQDTGPHLYGFDTAVAKKVFELILSCAGCGPKIGLAVLSSMQAGQFLLFIATSDEGALSQVPGIGPKKAQLMIMQLKDKVAKIAPEDLLPAKQVGLQHMKQVSAALAALHYKHSEIAKAIDFLNKNGTIESSSFDELLKQALSVLAKRL